MKQDGWFAALKHLTWLTQLGLSLAVPPLLSLLAAGWLAQKFSLGPWVWVLAVLLGLGAAGCTFAEFARMFLRQTGAKKPGIPDGGKNRPSAGGGQTAAHKDRDENGPAAKSGQTAGPKKH